MRRIASYFSLLLLLLEVNCKGPTLEIPAIDNNNDKRIKVSKLVTKSMITGNIEPVGMEKIAVNNKTYTIGISTISYFTYDSNDRISTNTINYAAGDIDSITYSYQYRILTIKKVRISVNKSREVTEETKVLNENGFAEYRPYNQAKYDRYGYLTSLTDCCTKFELKNGNLLARSMTIYPGSPLYTYNYQYDEQKERIPAPLTFYGQESRNLPVGYKVEEKTTFDTTPNKYYATYSYLYNANNLVKRELFYANESDSRSPFVYGGEKLVVKDYEYIIE